MDTKAIISTKSLVIAALFITLSFVGSHLKIFGTIAFDSLPGFLAALLLGPIYGAAIGFLGHLFTALTSGFPLSVPMHFVVAATMAITMYGFGFTYRALVEKFSQTTVLTITGIVGILLNAPVSLAFSMGMLSIMVGREAALGLLALLPVLFLAAIANVVISIIVFKAMRKVWGRII
jgi:uncharacterized membrane protein